MTVDTTLYYDGSELQTKDKLFNYVISERACGKTFYFKKLVIERYLKYGEQFMWVRRYSTELKGVGNMFADVAHLFPDVKIEIKGEKIYLNDKLAGYFVPLSKQTTYRSRNFDQVFTIVFDEFQVSASSYQTYMKDEVQEFLTLYDTVARNKELQGKKPVRAYFLGNSYSLVNPHFIFWKILPSRNKRFHIHKDICIEVFNNTAFTDVRKTTRFGRLVEGTNYGDMAFNNEFADDKDEFLLPKRPRKLQYMACFKVGEDMIGIWYNPEDNTLYIDQKFDLQNNSNICFRSNDLTGTFKLVKGARSNWITDIFVNQFTNNNIRFKNLTVQKIALNALNFLNIF